nr:MAG TPA: hypothetical protein [Caudoviricetes sp.]
MEIKIKSTEKNVIEDVDSYLFRDLHDFSCESFLYAT